MCEVWKDVVGYEGLYQVSNIGNVKSLNNNCIRKPIKHRCGYLRVDLWRDGKMQNAYVHRLVAQAFIPNPENKAQVNHINGNKTDNRTDNLEWVTNAQNATHAYRVLGKKPYERKNTKKVLCIETGIIYPSIAEAAKAVNGSHGCISLACNGRYKTHKKFHWKYVEDTI